MVTPRIAMYLKADKDSSTTEMCTRYVLKPIYASMELKAASPVPDIRFQCVRAGADDTEGRDDPILGPTRVKVGPNLWKDALRWNWSPTGKLASIRKQGTAPVHGNMGTSSALAEFTAESFRQSAERNMLMLWGHGGASLVALMVAPIPRPLAGTSRAAVRRTPTVSSVLSPVRTAEAPHLFQAVHQLVDASNGILGGGPGKLTLGQVAAGLKDGLNGKRLDALMLCQCQMASLEVAYEYRDFARFLVGSEELLAASEWPHATWLAHCASHPQQSTPELLAELLRQFDKVASTIKGGLDTYTLSCIDLDQIDALASKIDGLASAFGKATDKEWRAALAARKGLREFGDMPAPVLTVDLISFLNALSARLPKTSATNAAVKSCLTAAKNTVAGNKAGQSSAKGLAIYFPVSPQDAARADPLRTYWPQSGVAPAFSRDHQWVKFLADFHAAGRRLLQ